MTHIALLHHSSSPIVGGVESVIAHHARLLTEHGHSVTMLAARGTQTDPRIPFINLPLVDSVHPDVLSVKLELDRGIVPAEFALLRDALIEELRVAAMNIDVLIAHNVCSLNKNLALTAALYQLKAEPGFPHLILWHHDLAWTTPRYRPELHAGYPWDLLRTAWPNVTQVVVSEPRQHEFAELTGLPREAITIVPNGVEVAQLFKWEAQTQALVKKLGLLQCAPILLLPVRITPRKNIELALRVLAAVRQTAPTATLVVTGPLGPHNVKNIEYLNRLKHLRAELGLENAAFFLAEHSPEFLPDAVIADFYHLADALFFPSREEGFGIPALEAAFCHLPLFCADIPPLRTLGGEEATYFSPDADPAEVAADLMARLRSDRVYRFAVRARHEFTWEQIYQRHLVPLLTPDFGQAH